MKKERVKLPEKVYYSTRIESVIERENYRIPNVFIRLIKTIGNSIIFNITRILKARLGKVILNMRKF